ncbi:MAG TPA: helix-turn-helix domain-containing GNAT family N-acetyltransferase [Burkholderiales bacterium]|nr:helix-turn-helix domain-containing GNAT family N-acetyltransferase [Burkholderiales bacterium]
MPKSSNSKSSTAKTGISAVRRFNRFYTRRIGALQPHYLGSPYSLPQARVLYELGQRGECTASELGADLDLDLGYLSRLVQDLKRRGLVQGEAAKEDARRVRLTLTVKGRKAYQQLDARSRDEVGAMLSKLAAPEQERLVGALQAVESALETKKKNTTGISLRAHRPGDMGWVIGAHGRLYAQEYGWDERFEALVAGIAAAFVNELDKKRERCWIAEIGGEPVGCVFLVKQTKTLAKLRLLIVEPKARGIGVGRRLVEECIAFARAKGYSKLVLWTQSNLVAARHLYKSTGFKLVNTQRHQDFGIKLTGEYWELVL